MSQTVTAAPRGPATYDELKALRGSYALTLLGVLVISWCLSGSVQMLQIGAEASQQIGSSLSPVMVITLGIFPALLSAVVTGIYARKVGMPNPIVPAVIAPWPFLQWVALFIVVGYIPDHLNEFEPPENPPPVATWLIVGLLPVILMALLGALNPRYMAQLFLGPPVGANIPGLPIPCGWPILILILMSVVLSNIPLWLGFQKGAVRGWWKLLLAVLVLIHFTFPSVWLVLMGPAGVQVFKQFFSGQ